MNKIYVIVCLLIMAPLCCSEESEYFIKQTEKKKPRITVQNCYELVLSEMHWSSHIIMLLGQNQTNVLSYLDDAILENVDQKMLQRFVAQEQEYIKALEQFDEVQKKRRAFHEEFKRELSAKKQKK